MANRDDREILTFLWLDEVEVPEDFIRAFCLWEMIYEIGVINSGVKSRVWEALESQDSKPFGYFVPLCLSKRSVDPAIGALWNAKPIPLNGRGVKSALDSC